MSTVITPPIAESKRLRNRVVISHYYELWCDTHGVVDAHETREMVERTMREHKRVYPECFAGHELPH